MENKNVMFLFVKNTFSYISCKIYSFFVNCKNSVSSVEFEDQYTV